MATKTISPVRMRLAKKSLLAKLKAIQIRKELKGKTLNNKK